MAAQRATVRLRRGREGPLRGGNPWIFSNAIEQVEPGGLSAGTDVDVLSHDGQVLAYGYYNPDTTIAVRVLAPHRIDDPARLIGERVRAAIELRRRTIRSDCDGYRLINGEGDWLPGVVVDRYGDVLVVQLLTAGADLIRDALVETLTEAIAPRAILERSRGAVRRAEGLDDRVGPLFGQAVREVTIRENGLRLTVDLELGQKTGYFFDQRDNREQLRALAQGARVLDAFCYVGGFSLAALAGGAHEVIAVDSSAQALGWAKRNLGLNHLERAERVQLTRGSVLEFLRTGSDPFDLIVLDPPPLARSRKSSAQAQALYVELNAAAMNRLRNGGLLMTFSCSVHLHGENFLHALRLARSRAERPMRLLARLGPGLDHPVQLSHPEGEYLTGVLLAEASA